MAGPGKPGAPVHSPCPRCGEGGSTVRDSRDTEALGVVSRRRRRYCQICDHRWSTYEVPAEHYDRIVALIHAAEAFGSALGMVTQETKT